MANEERSFQTSSINWYPGHMTKARRMMEEDIKLIDLVIELVDARIPLSSRNPDIDQIGRNKARLILLNKCDLADEQKTKEWKKFFEDKGYFAVMVNSRDGQGIKMINNVVKDACKEKIERDRKRGIKNRPVRAMVVGIPNVGKSTFINSYAKKACTKTGNKPGVTKGKQWIKLSSTLELLDTPGILWPKFEEPMVGIKLALIGSINDNVINTTEMAMELEKYLVTEYPGVLNARYSIEESDDFVKMLSDIAENRKFLLKGNELNIDKAATTLLDEFRSGKLGKISLEECE
ncbi:MAG: ribosome biogenesis GTPase YlqF [Lachnospiraceae bacterium]|nr:ribosome biogenesis GTPase YlqF [Lachnospiraceae bacterium]